MSLKFPPHLQGPRKGDIAGLRRGSRGPPWLAGPLEHLSHEPLGLGRPFHFSGGPMFKDNLISQMTASEHEVEAIRVEIADKIGKRPHPETAYLIAVIRQILEEHKQYGKLTVRQVYYQLVSRAVIKNSKGELPIVRPPSHHGQKGRRHSWDAFEDRARTFHKEPLPQYNILAEDPVSPGIMVYLCPESESVRRV